MTEEIFEQINKPIEKFKNVKQHIDRLAGDYKCWDNRLTWKEALELSHLLEQKKEGHWKGYTHNAYHGTDEDGESIWKPVNVYHCSECNRRTVIKENFCPSCGTKMNGGK